MPCKAASDSFFLPCNNRKLHGVDASNRLRGPEGPQYWQASSSQSSTDHAIYTFFPQAVTSTPQYDFPPLKSVARQRSYPIDLVSPTLTPPLAQAFPTGTSSDFYADTEEVNGVREWDRLGEDRDRSISEFIPQGDVRPNIILDRFSASSPVPFPFLDPGDENVSATTPTLNRGSWGFPPAHLQYPARSMITPTSGLGLRSLNDQSHLQYDHESFYQQQVLGAWEREHEVEEMDRVTNVDNDGRSVSVLDVGWGVDPDGESEVWGVGQSWAADPYDSESADKSTEGPLFPER